MPGGIHRGADKSLARPGRKQARKHVRDARDFNNIETRADIKFLFLQGKAPKEIHAILTETVACFLPGRAKDLSARRGKLALSLQRVELALRFGGGANEILIENPAGNNLLRTARQERKRNEMCN